MQERVREAGVDRRAGSDARSEGRLRFGDFLEGGEKGQGSYARTRSAVQPKTTHVFPVISQCVGPNLGNA